MQLEHVPLLQLQRDLHEIPRGRERFNAYLAAMGDGEGDLRYPPLTAMNPMGREHVAERLDQLLALGADPIAESAVREAADRLPESPVAFTHGLCICDDLKGGWTNRYTTDAGFRFPKPGRLSMKRLWITTPLWVTEEPTAESIRQAVLASVARTAYCLEHGGPATLRQMLQQERFVAEFGGIGPTLDPDDLEYSRQVLEPLLDAADHPTRMAAMYGDTAARMLGYRPLGLSDYVGFEVAAAETCMHAATLRS